MSANGDNSSISDIGANDHQPTFIFTPSPIEDALERPAKRRRTEQASNAAGPNFAPTVKFESLLNGHESFECVLLRQGLFNQYWTETDAKIQSILSEANEETLAEVTSFVQEKSTSLGFSNIPTGFIATGPNIASQNLLFNQLSRRLRKEINGPVVVLRSGDSSNLKAVLKQIIRDATNPRSEDEDEGVTFEQDGQKLLNYDLGILYRYVKTHGCHKTVVAFQDSEAFDPHLLADVILLFNSWMDRIPFVLLFGIATSVELFNERLSRAASRCLYGSQFVVEQTSSVLENVFQRVIAGAKSTLRLGPQLVSSLMERQNDHVQSIQAFTTALKYVYMCHFYANPLSVLCDSSKRDGQLLDLLQPEHLEAVRMLPSFRNLVQTVLEKQNAGFARDLLEDDESLKVEIRNALESRSMEVVRLLRRMCILTATAVDYVGKVDLYLKAIKGTLNDSDTVRGVYDAMKRMSPESLLPVLNRIRETMENGSTDLDIDGWANEEPDFLEEISDIQMKITHLTEKSVETGVPIRSSYGAHSKGLRTTVIAQKVHLSYEKSTLSKQDIEYTALVDRLLVAMKGFFIFDNPQRLFLSEVWLYDSTLPYRDVFTPRPRFSIERALTSPQDYLPNCESGPDSLSSTNPPTANLYRMYLESGSLINISDLWTAFFSMIGNEEGKSEGCDERTALMLFYRGLADLRLLGMIKQSKKKVDHLAKSAWVGL